MTTIYKIHTNDGSFIDGSTVSSKKEGIADIRRHRGYQRAYLCEHCDGDAWSVYGAKKDRDNDRHGAYADTVTRIELDPRVK